MRKIMLTLVAALAAMAMLASTASADIGDRIDVIPGGNVTATAAGTLTLGGLINCNPVTLGANIATHIEQTATLMLIGSVTSASASNCGLGNSVTFLDPTSWRIWAFLPISESLVNLRFTGVAVQVVVLGGLATCLYAGDVDATFDGTTITFNRAPLARQSGSFLCPNPGELTGTMRVSPAQTIDIL